MRRAVFAVSALLLLPASLVAGLLPAGPEIPVSASTISDHCCPRIAVFPDGGFVVAWLASPLAGGKTTIHARLFGADGTPASGEFRLLPPSKLYEQLDGLATDRDGTLLVVWHENGGPGDLEPFQAYFRRLGRDGSAVGPRRALGTKSQALYSEDPVAAIAIRADGLFAVAWSACNDSVPDLPCLFFDSVAQVFRADGSPAKPRFLVEPGDDFGEDPLSSIPTAVVWNPDGTLTIASHDWASQLRYHAHVQRFTIGGRAKSNPIPLGTDGDRCPNADADLATTPAGGVLAVFWLEPCYADGYSIQSRRFTTALAGSAPMLQLDDGRFSSGSPHLAVMPDGGYVAIWGSVVKDDRQPIFGRSFAADSTPVSPEFQIARTTANYQFGPVIAATQDGGAVVAWEERSAGGSGSIFARILRPH